MKEVFLIRKYRLIDRMVKVGEAHVEGNAIVIELDVNEVDSVTRVVMFRDELKKLIDSQWSTINVYKIVKTVEEVK